MMKPPRALLFAAVAALAVGLLFAVVAVYASRQQHQAMPAAAVGAIAPAMAPRTGGALEAPLVVRKLAVPGAGTRPDDRGSHRALPDGARHHPGATKKWVTIGVVIAIGAVVLGALAVCVCCCLCARRKRTAAARELSPRAPSSPPWVQRPQAPAEPHHGTGGRDIAVDIPDAAGGENNGCRLCRRPYGLDGDEAPNTLSCGDCFHRRCIRRWVRENLSCPICNASQIVLLGVGSTGGETSRRYSTSNFGMQIRDDSVIARSTFSF